jgi:condensin complex subunit 1
MLQKMATLSLCKLMCISSVFCQDNLQLLFTLMEKSKNPTIRSNLLLSLGDLTIIFHSLIDSNIKYLYYRLRDPVSFVKRHALMVLSHLVLNGMVKVKGQLSEMAQCLTDSDSRTSDLTKLFFMELAGRDNAIYNHLPDLFSHLYSDENRKFDLK